MKAILPKVLTFLIFISGVMMLFSASTPAVFERLKGIEPFIPLPVIEVSHFFGSLIGLMLILLARGLDRRVDTAYVLTFVLLVAGACFSMLKGLNYEEAILLGSLALLMLPLRPYFHRKGSLLTEYFTSGWLISIFFVLACFLTAGFLSYNRIGYSDTLWWKFELSAEAPRFLRAALGVFILLFILSLLRLLSLARPKFIPPSAESLEKAKHIIHSSERSSAWLALVRDKSFLFHASGESFLMYRVHGRSWVVLSDPVGPAETWTELILEFRKLADTYNGWPVFWEVGKEHLPFYLDMSFNLLKIGEEARVFLPEFSLESAHLSEFRNTKKKLEEKGLRFDVIENYDDSFLKKLRVISEAWLKEKNTREKRFSLGYFDEEYLKNFPIGVVRNGEDILAFTNIWPTQKKKELSADMIRYMPKKSPNGVMDYLLASLLLWGKEQRYQWFSLGMAPLSGLENHPYAPLWYRLGGLVYRHGENFYNFQGLRSYKEKFHPVWEPRYLASPGGMAVPSILADVSSLSSGSWLGIFKS